LSRSLRASHALDKRPGAYRLHYQRCRDSQAAAKDNGAFYVSQSFTESGGVVALLVDAAR
jgi:hypothetical protein